MSRSETASKINEETKKGLFECCVQRKVLRSSKIEMLTSRLLNTVGRILCVQRTLFSHLFKIYQWDSIFWVLTGNPFLLIGGLVLLTYSRVPHFRPTSAAIQQVFSYQVGITGESCCLRGRKEILGCGSLRTGLRKTSHVLNKMTPNALQLVC